MKNRIIYTLMGLGVGFGIGSKATSKSNSQNATDKNDENLEHDESQVLALTEALAKISEYEETIKSLEANIKLQDGNKDTIANLNQQLAILQAEYDAFIESFEANNSEMLAKAGVYEETIASLQAEIELSKEDKAVINNLNEQLANLQSEYNAYVESTEANNNVDVTPVNGLHFDPNLVFDRSELDRNISIIDNVISINGVNALDLPVFTIRGSVQTEVRTKVNSEIDDIDLFIEGSVASQQIKIGNKEYRTRFSRYATELPIEPLVLLEFDSSVDLRVLLNNIVIGHARSSTNTAGTEMTSGFVGLYRSNILAFKLFNIEDHDIQYFANLTLKSHVGTSNLSLKSAVVVDSMSASIPKVNNIGPSRKLTGNATPLV